jgi:hypothetical protein
MACGVDAVCSTTGIDIGRDEIEDSGVSLINEPIAPDNVIALPKARSLHAVLVRGGHLFKPQYQPQGNHDKSGTLGIGGYLDQGPDQAQ